MNATIMKAVCNVQCAMCTDTQNNNKFPLLCVNSNAEIFYSCIN